MPMIKSEESPCKVSVVDVVEINHFFMVLYKKSPMLQHPPILSMPILYYMGYTTFNKGSSCVLSSFVTFGVYNVHWEKF